MGRRQSVKRRQAERDATEDVGVQLVLRLDLLASLVSLRGGESVHAVLGPAGEQAEEVADVTEGLDVLGRRQLTTSDTNVVLARAPS